MTPILAALAAGSGLALVVWGLSPLLAGLFAAGAVDQRILAYGIEGRRTQAVPDEPGFGERIVAPLLDRLRRFVADRTPDASVAAIESKLSMAGTPYDLGGVDFLILRAAVAAGGLALGLLAGLVTGNVGLALVGGAGLAAVLWALPAVWLDQGVAAQRRAIATALPTVLDFLAVCVDAGLTFDGALARVVERYRNPLTAGLEVAMTEVRLGRPRPEAYEAYGVSTGVDEVRRFITAVLQGETMGVPVTRTLRMQADEMRWRRRQLARDRGAQASVKMLIPLIVFVMPTIWLILLGPALIEFLSRGL